MVKEMSKNKAIEEAVALFEEYLRRLRQYDKTAYDLLDDEAEVTSTRRNIMTLRWTGKQFRELVGPSVEEAKKAGRKYELKQVKYEKIGEDVLVSGSFVPISPGQSGDFLIRIGRRNAGCLSILELHDGVPVAPAIRLKKKKVEARRKGGFDLEYEI